MFSITKHCHHFPSDHTSDFRKIQHNSVYNWSVKPHDQEVVLFLLMLFISKSEDMNKVLNASKKSNHKVGNHPSFKSNSSNVISERLPGDKKHGKDKNNFPAAFTLFSILQNSSPNSNRILHCLPYPTKERQRAQGEQSFHGLWLLEITC